MLSNNVLCAVAVCSLQHVRVKTVLRDGLCDVIVWTDSEFHPAVTIVSYVNLKIDVLSHLQKGKVLHKRNGLLI